MYSNLTADGTPFRFGKDADGNYGYIITDEAGADSVIPFSDGNLPDTLYYQASGGRINVTFPVFSVYNKMSFDFKSPNITPAQIILFNGSQNVKQYNSTYGSYTIDLKTIPVTSINCSMWTSQDDRAIFNITLSK